MWIKYCFRRIVQALPILIAVNALTFALFFMVNTPDDMARFQLGNKYLTTERIATWKHLKGLDKPLFFNREKKGYHALTDTLFFTQSKALFYFQFGLSLQGHPIIQEIKSRMFPSLALAIPSLLGGLFIHIFSTLLIILFRSPQFDRMVTSCCIIMLSISSLFYIIIGQFIVSKLLKLVPISGYANGLSALRFLILPIFISILSNFGANVRWYRSIFLEEVHQDYVIMAKSKGLSEPKVLIKHILRNALIPIITQVVALIPLLFMGSLLLESFFGIPGLGSYTVDAIHQQDFAIVRAMVFIGTLCYLIGLALTDIAYTWADPRIHLHTKI